MRKAQGILGALVVLALVGDLLLFFLKDTEYRDNPAGIFTEFSESVGSR